MLRGAVPTGPMLKVQPSWWRKLGLAAFGHLLVKEYAFERAFFREDALEVRKQVALPLVFVGGLRTRVDMERILSDGFDLLALGRPLIMNPDFVHELERGDCVASACEPCNHCIAEMDRGGVRCVAFD
jgi:2,4-dienoyl-CoA reductase-like NADH-dependent reductase (Old Yellow Enzyme family)